MFFSLNSKTDLIKKMALKLNGNLPKLQAYNHCTHGTFQILELTLSIVLIYYLLLNTEPNYAQYKRTLTSTDVLPRKPKSCSLNGSPSRLSAVSTRY